MPIEKNVSVIISAVDQYSGEIGKLGAGFNAVVPTLADFAEKALKAEAALAALAVGGITLAVKEASAFDTSFREITTLITATDEQVNKFRSDIINYAKDSTMSFEDINKAVYNAISAGIDYKDSLGALDAAEKLAVAGKGELNDTLVLLVSTLNSYGVGIDQATKFSDVMFTTVKQGQITIPELADALARVTGTASAANIPIETLTAAIAAITAGGLPASEAVTGLKAAITNIIKPSTEAEKAAAALGIEFGANALASKGFEGVLWELYQATGGNVEKMGQFFGSAEAFNVVMKLASDTGGKFSESLEAMKNSAGATEIAFNKMKDSIDLSVQSLINNLKAFLIEAGTPLLDEFGKILNAIADLFKGADLFPEGVLIDSFKPLYDFLEGFLDDIAEFIKGVAAALPDALKELDFTGLIASFEELGGALKGLFEAIFGDLDLTKPEDLAKFLQLIVDAFKSLTNVAAGVIEGMTPIIKIISDLAKSFVDADSDQQVFFGQLLGYAKSIEMIAPAIGGLVDAFKGMGSAMEVLALTNVAKLITSFGSLGTASSGLLLSVTKLFGILAAPIVGWEIGTWINEHVPAVGKFADELLRAADKVVNFTGTQNNAVIASAAQTEALGKLAVELVKLAEGGGDVTTKWESLTEAQRDQLEASGLNITALKNLSDQAKYTAISAGEAGEGLKTIATEAKASSIEIEKTADSFGKMEIDIGSIVVEVQKIPKILNDVNLEVYSAETSFNSLVGAAKDLGIEVISTSEGVKFTGDNIDRIIPLVEKFGGHYEYIDENAIRVVGWTEQTSKNLEEAGVQVVKLNDGTLGLVDKHGELLTSVKNTGAEYYNWGGMFDNIIDAASDLGMSIEKAADGSIKFSGEVSKITPILDQMGADYKIIGDHTLKLYGYNEDIVKELNDQGAVIRRIGDDTLEITNSSEMWLGYAEEIHEGIKYTKDEMGNLVLEQAKFTEDAGKASGHFDDASGSAKTLSDTVKAGSLEMKVLDDGVVSVSGNLSDVTLKAGDFKGVLEGLSDIEVKFAMEKFKSDLEILEINAKERWETIQTQVEWEAKVDIAQAEAAAKILEAAFESAAEMMSALGENIDTTVGAIAKLIGEDVHWSKWDELWDVLDRQLAMQEKLIDAQVSLMAAQEQLAIIQAEKLKEGEAMWEVKVSVEGDVEGWLSGLLSTLMEEIIVKAQGEALACLCSTT